MNRPSPSPSVLFSFAACHSAFSYLLHRSGGLKRLTAAIRITLVMLFLDLLVVFISTMVRAALSLCFGNWLCLFRRLLTCVV